FFTGHEDPAKSESTIDFDALAKLGGTQVMLMGVDRLAAITREMVAHGSRKDLPVALVRLGTLGHQKTIVGTLENIAERASAASFANSPSWCRTRILMTGSFSPARTVSIAFSRFFSNFTMTRARLARRKLRLSDQPRRNG